MKRCFFLLTTMMLCPLAALAGISQYEGKWSWEKYVPFTSVQEHYDLGTQALYRNNWDEALLNFMIIISHFEDSPFFTDSLFYSGICYYFKADFDLSNKQFDRYLASSGKLKHFEKVFDFKYYIADYYWKGERKHLFGFSSLPKCISGKEDALILLDEIIAALPGKEIAARSLFAKADILQEKREYHESIDALQTLVRRFPKHSLAADSYVKISEVYYAHSLRESQNPDLVSLAKISLNKFSKSFPGDERIALAEQNLIKMQEVYAKSLYDTARYYERKKKPNAAAIYYQEAVRKYPGTEAAQKSEEKLHLR